MGEQRHGRGYDSGGTHRAFDALASWNSYDQICPEGPIVRAVEWEKEPDPVPRRATNFSLPAHAIEKQRDGIFRRCSRGAIGSILDHDDQW